MMKQQDIILKSIDHQLEIFTEQYLMAREHNEVIPLIEIDLMKHSIRTLYQQLQYLQQIVQVVPQSTNLEPIATNPIFQFKKEIVIESSKINSPSIEFSEQVSNSAIENKHPIAPENTFEVENTFTANQTQENKPSENNELVKFGLEAASVIEQIVEEPVVEQPVYEPVVEQIAKETISEVPLVAAILEQPKVEQLQFETKVEQPYIEKTKEPLLEKEIVLEVADPSTQKSVLFNPPPIETKKTAPAIMASLFDEAPITVASKFKEQESVSDKIAKQYGTPTMAERLSVKSVVDLKKSIGINERFSFINELFSGNQQLFMESIDKINNQHAYEEARRILYEDLAGRMNWNTTAKPFSDLDELVKRRFNA